MAEETAAAGVTQASRIQAGSALGPGYAYAADPAHAEPQGNFERLHTCTVQGEGCLKGQVGGSVAAGWGDADPVSRADVWRLRKFRVKDRVVYVGDFCQLDLAVYAQAGTK